MVGVFCSCLLETLNVMTVRVIWISAEDLDEEEASHVPGVVAIAMKAQVLLA